MQSFFSSLTSKITSSVTSIASKLKPEEWDPPWKYLPLEIQNKEELIKTQILMLSKEKWNFLQAPSQEALLDFQFELERIQPITRAAMSHDSFLSSFHYFLVPDQISEEKFWFNYFAHIHVIFTSFGAEMGWRTPDPPVPLPSIPPPLEPITETDISSAPSSCAVPSDTTSSFSPFSTSSANTSSSSYPSDSSPSPSPSPASTSALSSSAFSSSSVSPSQPTGEDFSPEELAMLDEASNADLGDLEGDVNFDELQDEIGKALEEE